MFTRNSRWHIVHGFQMCIVNEFRDGLLIKRKYEEDAEYLIKWFGTSILIVSMCNHITDPPST